MFRPVGLRSFTVTEEGGSKFITAEASACLDCGLVWGDVVPSKLRDFIQRYCRNGDSVPMSQCFKCGSNRVAKGRIGAAGEKAMLPTVFQPAGRQAFTLTLGGPRFTGEALACLDCGFAWNSTSPEKLRNYIQKQCDQTPENAMAFEGCRPSSAWKETWIGGIGVALVPFGYGVYCMLTGHAYVPCRHRGFVNLQGSDAVVMAIAYIGLGAYVHFRYFWGRHPRLRSRNGILGGVALSVFIGGCLYTAFRHLF